ncbi:MAG: hypothetical protein BRD41_03440 [Bacteroidetes bacterium QS_1_63_11]|nr:MAG: hypothetical protein BRD41_03440 [Bacteroidetes bacterium QS_1_63_11]
MSGRCRDLVQILEATPNDSRYANPPAAVTHRLRPLASTPAEYTGLAWRPSGDDLAALRTRESDDWEDETHVLLAWEDLGAASPPQHRFAPKMIDAFPDTLRIVDYRTPKWSDDGNRLFFSVQERDSATTGPNGPGMRAPGTARSGSTAADSTARGSSFNTRQPPRGVALNGERHGIALDPAWHGADRGR